MDTEFLSIIDCDDYAKTSAILRPSQMLGEIIDTKTSGKYSSRVYKPTTPETARVYSYNFKTRMVELDEIVAIEQICSTFQNCEISTYKTPTVELSENSRIATVDRTAAYKLKYSTFKDLMNSKSLAVLQVENYIETSSVEDVMMIADNGASELELPMTFDIGLLVGHWLGSGVIREHNGVKSVVFYPSNDTDLGVLLNTLQNSFPDDEQNVSYSDTKWGNSQVIFSNRTFAIWLGNIHNVGNQKSLPMIYYSAPIEFISGLLYGMMMATGRHSLNRHKKVMYYTFSSISEILIRQLIEILNIYASIHANISNFTIEKTKKELFLANIRVTSSVLDSLPIGDFVEDIDDDYIPKSNRHTLKTDDSIMVVTRMTIKQIEDTEYDYVIHLKNNSNIIDLVGLVHRTKCRL